jgi:hypothetical protein
MILPSEREALIHHLSFKVLGTLDPNEADRLMREIECYKAGLAGTVPDAWHSWHREFILLNDPEYDTYRRLKNKFGNL